MSKHAGFATAGAGDHQERLRFGRYSLALGIVQ
jgi:hypothetical protein